MSRCQLTNDCPAKLHYTKREHGNRNNDFPEALADRGHQVGATAEFRSHPGPRGRGLTVETLVKHESIRETQARLQTPTRRPWRESHLQRYSLSPSTALMPTGPWLVTTALTCCRNGEKSAF